MIVASDYMKVNEVKNQVSASLVIVQMINVVCGQWLVC